MSKEDVLACFIPREGDAPRRPWISKADIAEAFDILYEDVDSGVLGTPGQDGEDGEPGPPGPPGTPLVMALMLGD